MNEIEAQKLLVKQAFSKAKALPDFGGIGDDNSIKLRNYIWKASGFTEQAQGTKSTDNGLNLDAASKKNALVTLYRLWSAFTKNIRYIIDIKGKSVSLSRFGTFIRNPDEPQTAAFIPSSELVNQLNAQPSYLQSTGETNGPEWAKIAPAAQLPS